jgi:hypothetical protein
MSRRYQRSTLPTASGWSNSCRVAWMQVFYDEQVGMIESQELKTKPIPHWLFRLTGDDPVERTYFVVLLADGTVVEPKLATRL